MKFFFISVMSLSSALTFANTLILDDVLEFSSEGTFVSRNYESLVHNDDGRVTIINPKFSSADGQTRYLSSTSNNNGICKLFGFGQSVDAGRLIQGNLDRTVVIDLNGKFNSFVNYSSSGYNRKIQSIMCENAPSSNPSINYDKVILNDDGTKTVINPKFSSADGQTRYLSSTSNNNGVCKLFGFGQSIDAGRLTQGDLDRTVVIDLNGKFNSFVNYSSSGYNRKIQSIMCN